MLTSKRSIWLTLALVTTLTSLMSSGCATLTNGLRQQVVVHTSPPGADVIIAGRKCGTTPCEVSLSRKKPPQITLQLDGYESEIRLFSTRPTGRIWRNVWWGGIPGLVIDLATGADNEISPGNVEVNLRPSAYASRAAETSDNSESTSKPRSPDANQVSHAVPKGGS